MFFFCGISVLFFLFFSFDENITSLFLKIGIFEAHCGRLAAHARKHVCGIANIFNAMLGLRVRKCLLKHVQVSRGYSWQLANTMFCSVLSKLNFVCLFGGNNESFSICKSHELINLSYCTPF